MAENRIEQTSIAVTGNRQTPKNDFGDVLVRTTKEAVGVGGTLLAAVAGGPIATAAVAGVTSVLGLAVSNRSGGAANPSDTSRQTVTGSGTTATGNGHSAAYNDAAEAAE